MLFSFSWNNPSFSIENDILWYHFGKFYSSENYIEFDALNVIKVILLSETHDF